jgi:hypothetical protein
MKFVSPDTTRLDLKDGQWVEVKKHLSAVEEKRFRTAGMKRMSQRRGDNDEPQQDIEIDWAAMSLARVTSYLVEWSAKNPDGSRMKVSKDAINQLDSDSFDEIDLAIQAHIEKMADEKKAPSGRPSLTAV